MRTHTLGTLLVATLLASAPFGAAFAGDAAVAQTQGDVDQARLQLRTQLHQDPGMTEAELDELDPELAQYFRLRGDADHLRATLRHANRVACTGACMNEAVRAMNRAMLEGMQDQEAGQMVQTCLNEQSQERVKAGAQWTQSEEAEKLKVRTQERLHQWEQHRASDVEQEMKLLQRREMEKEMNRQMNQGGGHGGGNGGGGSGGHH